MPTGYAAPIEEDPDFTFEQYVWRCARAFLVECKDSDGPIPECYELRDHYTDRIKEAEADLFLLEAMTLPTVLSEAQTAFERHVASQEKCEQERLQKLARYDAMQAKVEAWDPQDKVVEKGLKAMLLEQIATSTDYMRKPSWVPPEPPLTTEQARAWKQERITQTKENLQRSKDGLQKAQENNAKTNAWLVAIRATVPQPEGS